MDEILIEEKKYVSSKRAAQITGYAKDYIGQLCREGRVPARLVGRSWYVLESAIEDHRFGKPDSSTEDLPKDKNRSDETSFPRYEAVEAQILPSVNRLRETAPIYEERGIEAPRPEFEAPQSSTEEENPWRNWFDMAIASSQNEEANGTHVSEEPGPSFEEAPSQTEDDEVEIPIRAIYHPELSRELERRMDEIRPVEPPVQAIIEATEEENVEERAEAPMRVRSGFSYRVPIQILAIVIAAVAVLTASLGTGYADRFTKFMGPASVLAGISSVENIAY